MTFPTAFSMEIHAAHIAGELQRAAEKNRLVEEARQARREMQAQTRSDRPDTVADTSAASTTRERFAALASRLSAITSRATT
jgi:hypothetical protein